MAYKNKYRIPLKNPGVAGVENSEGEFSVIIQERDYEGIETILKGNVDGGVLRYLDNEERKYPAIQASELDIIFYSEDNFSLERMITGDDLQYKAILAHSPYNGTTFDDRPLWYGYLITDDCTESTEADPKEIRLRANDGISFLKTQPLYDISVYEKRDLLQIINRCLSFTGHDAGFLVEVNVFEETMLDRTDSARAIPFNQCKIHTRSFLSDANTYMYCYEVLERILTAFQCTIFQQGGRWIIQRKHDRWNQEMDYGTLCYFKDGPMPVWELTSEINNYKVDIDSINRYPITHDQLRGYKSTSGQTRIKYKYQSPIIPRNANFMQGEALPSLSNPGTPANPPTPMIPGNTATTIAYWTYRVNTTDFPESTYVPYRNEVFHPETKVPIEPHIVLPNRGASTTAQYLESEGVEVSRGDKLSFSAGMRTKNNIDGISAFNLVQLIIVDSAGNIFYFHHTIGYDGYYERSPYWDNSVLNGWVSMRLKEGEVAPTNEWYNGSFVTASFPVDGTLYIRFWSNTDNADNETWYRGITFEWLFFINSGTQIIGEQDTIAKAGKFWEKTEEEINVGDAPKKTVDGALFRGVDQTRLTDKWHRQGKEEREGLIRLNDICLHQSTHRLYNKIDGTFLGIAYQRNDNTLLIGPANLFRFTVAPLNNKYFLPTNLEISLGTNTFRANFQEFYDTEKDNGDPKGDTQVFQYIYE